MSPIDPGAVAENPGLLTKLLAGSATIIAGLVGRNVRQHEKRIEGIEAKLETKANVADFERQRDHIGQLFEECKAIRKDVAEGRVENLKGLQSLERTIRDSVERRSIRED